MTVRILQGDCRDVLRGLPNGSVHCVVTSPPYFGLRDYGVDGQIGLEQTPDAYVAELVSVFREVRRVLRDDGTAWLNLGDSYASAGGKGEQGSTSARNGRKNVISQQKRTSSRPPSGLKPKDLIGIPWAVATALRAPYYAGKIKAERDRAWMAAMIDGEGSISGFHHLRADDGSPRTGLNINITNSSIPLLDEAFQIWPTSRQEHNVHGEGHLGSLPTFRWIVHGTDNKSLFLRELFPYLIAKKRQALVGYNLLLAMENAKSIGHSPRRDEMREKRKALTDLISALNQNQSTDLPGWLIEPPTVNEPGWWLRQDNIWAKRNCMPESIKDRTTRAHEYLFQLTKSGSSTFWTHRDRIGTRKSPAPDYRWVHKVSHEEKEWEPPDPKEWRRINLWSGHDYFYDVVAIEEEGDVPAGTRAAKGSNVRSDLKDVNGRPPEYWSYTGKRNKRSVWHIATQPFPEAHFATFPPDLVEPCILAGTSARGCCSACGAPWTRVTEKSTRFASGSGRAGRKPSGKGAGGEQTESGEYDIRMGPVIETRTTGWQPSCSCGATIVPCTVLDSFGGAGTVGLVADRLGRDAILIELNPEYAEIARRRLERDGGMFTLVSNEAQDAKTGQG